MAGSKKAQNCADVIYGWSLGRMPLAKNKNI